MTSRVSRASLLKAGGATAAAVTLFPRRARASDAKVVRIGHTLSAESEYQKWCLRFGELVKSKTGGRYNVQAFYSSQLGGEIQMVQAARAGTQEMLICSQPALEATVKPLEIFSIPYIFDSIEQGNRVMAGKVGQYFLDSFNPFGMVAMAWGSVQERNVFTTSRPVRTLEDMKNLKIRIIQSPGYVEAYRALGANPTPMAYNQLYLALKEKTVDGGDTSPDQFFMDKFSEVAKYYSLTHVHYLPAAMIASKMFWDELAPKDKDAFMEAGRQAAPYNHQVYKADYVRGLKEMRPANIELIKVDTKPWIDATQDVRKKLIATVADGQKLYDMIIAAKR